MTDAGDEPMPPYAFVPGGAWPHPTASPQGHSFRRPSAAVEPIRADAWAASAPYLRGVALFNEGYYWEAHEAWEALWHAHGRHGPYADVLKGLIKLAAAGVKVREGQPHGVVTHARRASALFRKVGATDSARLLGLDLTTLAELGDAVADAPPADPAAEARVSRVFAFRIEPRPA